MERIDDFKESSISLQHGVPTEQACASTNDSNASGAKIQDLERACYDLDAKMKVFKRKTRSNQLRIKDYAKGIKEYATNIQVDQDELRGEVGNIFYSLEDELSLLDDNMEIRLSNVESRVLALIEEKLKAERRKGWCRKNIGNI
ncbi:unnamed protein product [Mucor fragilis]